MNLLAHAYLAGDDDDALVGQLVADYLSPGWKERYLPEVLREIRCHQRIDAFTDSHPIARRTGELFDSPFVLYRGILVDMFYGHCLGANWERYSDIPLEEFAAATYRRLEARTETLGEKFQRVLPHMAAGDWLTAYGTRQGILAALAGISKRLKHENPLADSGPFFYQHYEAITTDFHEFFPVLVADTKRWRAENP